MFRQFFNPSHGGKATALAYAAVGATAAGMTLFVVTRDSSGDLQSLYPFGTQAGVVFVGAISGLIALFLTRRWMGLPGNLGLARAAVGGFAMAFVAALIAGTVISPIYGTFFAPIMLVAAFGAKPWLAVAWFMVVFLAHGLLARRAKRVRGVTRISDSSAIGQLSALSQANLYRKRNQLH